MIVVEISTSSRPRQRKKTTSHKTKRLNARTRYISFHLSAQRLWSRVVGNASWWPSQKKRLVGDGSFFTWIFLSLSPLSFSRFRLLGNPAIPPLTHRTMHLSHCHSSRSRSPWWKSLADEIRWNPVQGFKSSEHNRNNTCNKITPHPDPNSSNT